VNSTLSGLGETSKRLLFGPRRTHGERRSAIVGAALGGLAGSFVGVVVLALGMATSSDWQTFAPPVALFVLLPIPAGILAGLRFTVELTRPERLSWRRLIAVSLAVTFLAVALTTSLIGLGYEGSIGWPNPVTDLVSIAVVATVYSFFVGLFLVPIVVPAVAIIAVVVRRLGPARPSQPGRTADAEPEA